MHPDTPPGRDAGRLAVVAADSDEALTHADVAADTERLRGSRTNAGDVVALLARASPRALGAYWAALRAGFAVVPIDCALSLEEVAYLVNDSGARVLVAAADVADLAAEVRPLTPCIERRFAFGGPIAGHETYEPTVPTPRGVLFGERWGHEIFYSAGVTGRPRAAGSDETRNEYRRRLRHLLTGSCAVDSETVYHSTLPLADALAAQTLGVVHAAGGTVVTTTRPAPECALAAVERRQVTVLHLAPATLVGMLKLPETVRATYDLSSLRAVILSAAPCPPEAKRQAIMWLGPIVHEIYNCAERTGLTFLAAAEPPSKWGSVGRSLLGSVHICGPEGAEVPAGVTGRVYFEHDGRNPGAADLPDHNAFVGHPYHPDWSTPGDLGTLDDDGFLYLADREAFVIRSGGTVVYPREVEDVLVMHPGVADVAVIGIRDETIGQQIKAVIKVDPAAVAGLELERDIVEFARGRLSSEYLPRTIDFAEDIPRTESGKLAKRVLARKYALADSVRS